VTSLAGRTPVRRLSDFIRARREDIVQDWASRVQSLSPARELSNSAIVDHLPLILARVADMVEAAQTGKAVSLGDLPRRHAVDRLGRGFDFDQIVVEFNLLRRAILDLWAKEMGADIDVRELRHLGDAFDDALAESAAKYASAREKLLRGLDRVSEAALGSADLDVFLQDLATSTLTGTEAVDTCVVLLREGDVLRVRAAAGLEDELRTGFCLRIGEGFAGQVAAEGHPLFLKHAADDPRVKSPAVRVKGVRAMYGVPLKREDRVIGVAHIGSLTAFEFSDEDKLLFRTMVSRATSGIVKAQILGDLRRAETAQRFLADASRELAESLEYQATLQKIARLAVPAIADWCVVDLREGGSLRRVSVAHADPEKENLARELEHKYPTDPEATAGIPQVIRSGMTEWSSDLSEQALRAAARDDGHLTALRQLGLKAFIIAPIQTRSGAIGAITLITAESNRRYSLADVQVAEDLGRRVGMAIDNARLYSEAQHAVAVRDRILAVVSHDLRNQLGIVKVGTQLLFRRVETLAEHEELRKPIDAVQRTADSMQRLVSDLLDMASLQAGRLAIVREPFPIGAVLREAYDSHEPIAEAKGLSLKAVALPADACVLGDRERLLQVLSNILGNAMKFTDAGGSITLRASATDGEVNIVIEDTGVGIPPEHLDQIFDPYQSFQRAPHRGTGLGLYISQGIVLRHGGKLKVRSTVGEGSAFTITLPRLDD